MGELDKADEEGEDDEDKDEEEEEEEDEDEELVRVGSPNVQLDSKPAPFSSQPTLSRLELQAKSVVNV